MNFAKNLVLMFPGQSSRYPGMLQKLIELDGANEAIVRQASLALDWNLFDQFATTNPNAFRRNVDVQVGVFLANHLFLSMLSRAGIVAEHSLGLSLGEYNHLVHIGALDFESALHLVRERGRLYDEGPRGFMVAVQPIDSESLRSIVTQVQDLGTVEVVNLNSPRQQVIAGDQVAVEAAVRLLEEEHYCQGVVIEREVPMHSSLFEIVGRQFRHCLAQAPFHRPVRAYLPNRLGYTLEAPSQDTMVQMLSEHVHSPVLWQKSIDFLRETLVDPIFVEVGPMGVLTNLLHPKWCKPRKYRLDSAEGTAAHLRSVIAELSELCHPGRTQVEESCIRT